MRRCSILGPTEDTSVYEEYHRVYFSLRGKVYETTYTKNITEYTLVYDETCSAGGKAWRGGGTPEAGLPPAIPEAGLFDLPTGSEALGNLI